MKVKLLRPIFLLHIIKNRKRQFQKTVSIACGKSVYHIFIKSDVIQYNLPDECITVKFIIEGRML